METEIMVWIIGLVSALSLLLVTVHFVGLLLPRSHSTTATARIETERQAVWDYVIGHSVPGNARTANQSSHSDHGPLGHARPSRDAQTAIEVLQIEEPELLVLAFDDGHNPFVGTWTFELDPVYGGTLLTLTEAGEVSDPFYRFLARVLFRDASDLKGYVDEVQRTFGPSAR